MDTTWSEVRRGQWVRISREGGRAGVWSDVAKVVRWERDGGTCLVALETLDAPGARGGRGFGSRIRTASYRADTPVTVVE